MFRLEPLQLTPDAPTENHAPHLVKQLKAGRRHGETIYPLTLSWVKPVFGWGIALRPGKTGSVKPKHVRPGLEKRTLVVRLRRIKGQVEALERMVEADADCSDVLMQVVSARRALKSFSEELIESHVHECIENAAGTSEGRREIESLITVLKRYAV